MDPVPISEKSSQQADSEGVIPRDANGKPVRSKYLKPKENPILPPEGLDITVISSQIAEKRTAYFADWTIIKPLKYTADELKVLKYLCETGPFYPLTHLGLSRYMLSHDARLLNTETNYITRGSVNKIGRRVFTLSNTINGIRRQRQIQANILMAMAFLGPAPTPQHDTVDHMDIDYTNDYVYNLRWATPHQQQMNRRKNLKPKRGRPVTQIDPDTGTEMFTWFRMKDATKSFGFTGKAGIVNAIKDKQLCGGWRWRYADNLIIDNDGTFEEWRQLCYPQYGDVWVSSMGRVKSAWCGFWFGHTNLAGRKVVGFKLRDGTVVGESVHRLVALAFIGPPPSEEEYSIDHIDGNSKNNRAKNLRYITVGDNNRHAFVTGARTSNYQLDMCKAVVQLDLKGNFVKEYFSAGEAHRQTGFRQSHIHRVIKGERPTAFGHKWLLSKDYFKGNPLYE